MKKIKGIILLLCLCTTVAAEDGHDLWLRFRLIDNPQLLATYRNTVAGFVVYGNSPTIAIIKNELNKSLSALLGKAIKENSNPIPSSLVVGTPSSSVVISSLNLNEQLSKVGAEGFVIISKTTGGKKITVIAANTDIGALHGVFDFLRLIQTHQDISNLNKISFPKIDLRILDHWDNLNRYVERGYAGISIWDWHKLPDYIDPIYTEYARANASIGINGTVLTNVNANALTLTSQYLEKAAALANIFRPYGIKVYLTARFSAPSEIGGISTSDPLNDSVQTWWKNKVQEIYKYIPDFGGFLVKANSEGQPGPQNYGRTHADGANMLADAVKPYHGVIMWRAFVYANANNEDRAKQAYEEFVPLDGKFRDNVLLQVKNGPIDFQPREPFHPLFGSMPKTPMMMEFQLTQEYLGFATHLVFLPVMFKEILQSDTYAQGKGSYVAKVIDGSLDHHSISGIAGVANIGNDINWTGHPFGQANWYGFGRLAWDEDLSAATIAEEWIRQTFSNDNAFVSPVKSFMLSSHETLVNYMTPLGLHHIMGNGHHYGPSPWSNSFARADWNPVYFHRSDSMGIGFDRSATGSNAIEQYFPEARRAWENTETCDEKYLLWFHHVAWKHKMKSGRNLWEELCYKYYNGVDSARKMKDTWVKMKPYVDSERFEHVLGLLEVQVKEAIWWRNACLLYFQTFSKMPIPSGFEKPDKTLEYYESLKFPYAPGN
ncbi:MAG: alpha-glucuronidase [Bacteroidetes bacterium]|nr:MAG: alpha-glucuronidase [Bacteroidota bacterium]